MFRKRSEVLGLELLTVKARVAIETEEASCVGIQGQQIRSSVVIRRWSGFELAHFVAELLESPVSFSQSRLLVKALTGNLMNLLVLWSREVRTHTLQEVVDD